MGSPQSDLPATSALADDYSTFHHNSRSPALLSDDVASLVSTAASATRLSLKATHALTDLLFDAAKYTTSASLGVSRRALVHAISTAWYLHALGRKTGERRSDVSDVFVHALEKYTNYGINFIHHTFCLAELFALAGVQLTSRFVANGLAIAEGSVRMLDGIFGSTETSRALAAVVHLVRKEIYEDEDFQPVASMGKLSVLARITKAFTAYACLQNATHARSMNRVRMTLLYKAEVSVGGGTDERANAMAHGSRILGNEEASGTCPSCMCQIYCDQGYVAEPTTSEYTDPRIAVPGTGTASESHDAGSPAVTTAVVAMPERVVTEPAPPDSPSPPGLLAVPVARPCACSYHLHRCHHDCRHPHNQYARHCAGAPHSCHSPSSPSSFVELERETVEHEFEFQVNSVYPRSEGVTPAQLLLNPDENGEFNARSCSVDREGRKSHRSINSARRSNVLPGSHHKSPPNPNRDATGGQPQVIDLRNKPAGLTSANSLRSHLASATASATAKSKPNNSKLPRPQGSLRRSATLPSSSLPIKTSKSLSLLFDSMNWQPLSGAPKKLRVKVTEVKSTRTLKRSTQVETDATTAESGESGQISSPGVKCDYMDDSGSLRQEELPSLESAAANPGVACCLTQRERIPERCKSSPSFDVVLENWQDSLPAAPPRISKRQNGESVPCYPHFPALPFLQNLWRFLRYSTAAYGPALMSLVGVGQVEDLLHLPAQICAPHFSGSGSFGHHPNHHALARHTQLPVASILLSSFSSPGSVEEPENPSRGTGGDTNSRGNEGSNSSGSASSAAPTPATTPLLSPPKMHALVHYVVVDHMAKAIVLTCRGTLGLSDILTDATCQYEELSLQGEKYRVHAGFLRSARMLGRPGGEALRTLRRALEEYEGYGLILTGHSLGGAVAAILAMLWSEPVSGVQEEGLDAGAENTATDGGGDRGCPALRGTNSRRRSVVDKPDHHAAHRRFVTSRESGLPPGRPVHCYGYGVPALTDAALSRACLGLVTTIVHNADIVPSLSFGLIRDFKNVAVSLWWEGVVNPNGSPVSAEGIIRRALGVRRNRAASAATESSPAEEKSREATEGATASPSRSSAADGNSDEDEEWLWALMKTLRANMAADKLVPPGAVYIVSSHIAPVDVSPAPPPARSPTSCSLCCPSCQESPAASVAADSGTQPSAGKSLASSLLQRSIGLRPTRRSAQVRRATLHRVEDVATRFSEIHFSRTMFSDHSPKGYEEAVGCLVDGWKPSE